MGIDRHEQERRGGRRPSGAARRRAKRHAPTHAETLAKAPGRPSPAAKREELARAAAVTPANGAKDEKERARFLRGAALDEHQGDDAGPPQAVETEPVPAAPEGTRVSPPATESRREKLDRTGTVDVRIPRAMLAEFAELTGEPVTPATGCLRAALVLLRSLSRNR